MRKLLLFLLAGMLVTASCKKQEDDCEGDPPPSSNLDELSFIVVDSAGKNMLNGESGSRLSLSSLVVTQPCVSYGGNAQNIQNGRFRLHFQVLPQNGVACKTVYLKWNEGDTDTLTYEYVEEQHPCFSVYRITSFSFNGNMAAQDTATKGVYEKTYVLQK